MSDWDWQLFFVCVFSDFYDFFHASFIHTKKNLFTIVECPWSTYETHPNPTDGSQQHSNWNCMELVDELTLPILLLIAQQKTRWVLRHITSISKISLLTREQYESQYLMLLFGECILSPMCNHIVFQWSTNFELNQVFLYVKQLLSQLLILAIHRTTQPLSVLSCVSCSTNNFIAAPTLPEWNHYEN